MNVIDKDKYIFVDTYPEFWKIETTFYSVEGHQLPFPLTLKKLGYFGLSLLFFYIISSIPVLNWIRLLPILSNPLWYYILLPAITTKILNTVLLEGKSPLGFFADYMMFLTTPKYYESFESVNLKGKGRVKFFIPFRTWRVAPAIEMKMTKKKDKQQRFNYEHI